MSVSPSIPATVEIRRSHLLGLIGGAAVLAACVTWVVTAFALDTGASKAASSSTSVSASQPTTFTATRKQIEGLSTMAPQQASATFAATRSRIASLSTTALRNVHRADPVMWMTPAQLAGLGLGTGYQLPNTQSLPTADAVLASMSPDTRRYTESVMNLTFNQLAAGAAGHP